MLAGFYQDFPVDDIKLCVDTLAEVTEKALRASRNVVSEKPFVGAVPAATVVAVNAAADIVASAEDNEIDQLMAA